MGKKLGKGTREKGQEGEDLVVQFLLEKSFEILVRNYTIPSGELDIIARHRNIVVFVEVKSLNFQSRSYEPEEQVTYAKRRRCEKAAAHWLQQNKHEGPCRFDVVGLRSGLGQKVEIYHIEDAWEEGD